MPKRFVWIATALFAFMIVLDAINGRLWLNDLRVYWEASRHFLHGEAAYGASFGLDSGFYKYAPFGLLVFAPLAMLPYSVATILFAALIAFACVYGLLRADRVVRRELHQGVASREVVLFLGLLLVAVHFQREVHLGNVNMLLLLVLLIALDHMLYERPWIGGAMLGGVLLLKPHFVVLVPLLVLHRRWRELVGCATAVTAGVLLPALITGWQRSVSLHADWFRAMATHNAGLFFVGEDSRTAADTLYTVLHRASFGALPPTTATAAVILVVVAALILWLDRRCARSPGERSAFTFLYLLLIAAVPSLTVTDTEHFLFSMPLVLFLLHAVLLRQRAWWLWLVVATVLFGYGGNWQDPLGAFGEHMAELGVLGASNVLLVLLAAYLFLRRIGSSPG